MFLIRIISKVPSPLIKEAREGDKRVLLLTIIVGLSLFLLNVVFTTTFYFFLQQRKVRANSTLIAASEADQGENKNDQITKPVNENSRYPQQVVTLSGLECAMETEFQATAAAAATMSTDFHRVTFGALQQTSTPHRHSTLNVYQSGSNRTTPLLNRQILATLDPNWNRGASGGPSFSII
uniref:Uncharacterized protein n=1 Tax=Mesocestoides corti TaxID=53468 RepID=A0A5K3FLZ4_MESCO